jgi:hypothetical protein
VARRGASQGTLLLLAVAAGAYAAFLREPILTWGATTEEAAGRLPGDELRPMRTALRRERSGSTRRPTPCGRGSCRWGPRRAVAPTRTTGSRTCWGWTCTAPIACSRSTSTLSRTCSGSESASRSWTKRDEEGAGAAVPEGAGGRCRVCMANAAPTEPGARAAGLRGDWPRKVWRNYWRNPAASVSLRPAKKSGTPSRTP